MTLTLLIPILLVALLFVASGLLFATVRRAEREELELVDRQRGRFESDFKALVRRLEAASTAVLQKPVPQPAAPRATEGESHRDPRRKKRSKGGRRPR